MPPSCREFRLQLSRGTQRAEVPLSPKLAVDDPAVLHAATAAGLGIGLLPEFLCRQGLATGRLKPVLPEWTLPPAAALMRCIRPRSRRTRACSSSWISWPRTSCPRSLAAPAARHPPAAPAEAAHAPAVREAGAA